MQYFFNFMKNAGFERAMENKRKQRNINLVTNKKNKIKKCPDNLFPIEVKKTQKLMNKPINQ